MRQLLAVSLATAFAAVSMSAQVGIGQATTYGALRGWKAPRTMAGQPDLEGVWANNAVTPMTRPPQWRGKDFLTPGEVRGLQEIVARYANQGGDAIFGDIVQLALDAKDSGTFDQTSYDRTTGNYNQFWMAEREWDNRTSLIIDPPDGRLPPLTSAQAHGGHPEGADPVDVPKRGPADGPEDRSLSERCISYGVPGFRAGYNSYLQIVQSAETIIILQELIHDARIVPLGNASVPPKTIRQVNGMSRGRWEGDTLVVETMNFLNGFRIYVGGGQLLGTSTPAVRITERYTRVSPDYINWAITVDDAATWTRPWTFMVRLKRTDELLYEYACHEGNQSMIGILAGARAAEAKSTSNPSSPRR
jgi:hypothetical protein